MAMPLIVGLVIGALALVALAIYANRPQSQTVRQAAAQPSGDGYTPMVFGDSSSDCASDGGAGCGGDGGGGGGD